MSAWFKPGDRVKVAEDAQDYNGDASILICGHVGTVTDGPDGDGDICVQPDGRDYTEYVQPEFCTLVEPAEPETTWPRRVLAWGGCGARLGWQDEDGTLRMWPSGRMIGDVWTVDTRVTIPDGPPEPEREVGLWLVKVGQPSPVVARWTGDDWEWPASRLEVVSVYIEPIARLTDDQVAKVEAAS